MAIRAFVTDADGNPVTRLVFYVDEATTAQMAGPDAGRAGAELAELHYTSPGTTGQAWKATGTIDATYGRLEASLTSDTGPWTDIGAGGSLADPSSAGTPQTLWVRYVAHRWNPSDANPDSRFDLALSFLGSAAVDED